MQSVRLNSSLIEAPDSLILLHQVLDLFQVKYSTMDKDQQIKFAIHEAAREGRSTLSSLTVVYNPRTDSYPPSCRR